MDYLSRHRAGCAARSNEMAASDAYQLEERDSAHEALFWFS